MSDNGLGLLERYLVLFLAGTSWEEKRNIVIAHPELLGEEAIFLLGWWIIKAQKEDNQEYEQTFTLARMILERCRAVGIDDTFAEFMESMPVMLQNNGESISVEVDMEKIEPVNQDEARLEELRRVEEAVSKDHSKLPYLVALLEEALSWPVVTQNPNLLAAVYLDLGSGYRNLQAGIMVQNFRRAIVCLKEALKVYTFEAEPEKYATVKNELGLVYLDLPTGDQTENFRNAITSFQEALRFRTPETCQIEYAATQNNLGMALTRLRDKDWDRNMLLSVDCFNEALQFYTAQDNPEEYVKVYNNLGTAYYALREVDPQFIQSAIECYKNALTVLSENKLLPILRPSVLINLGKAYASLKGDYPVETLHKAISFYQRALNALDRSKNLHQVRARAYEAIAQAYRDLSEWDPTNNLKQAIENYHCALTLLTPNTFPDDMRRIALTLGNIYLDQQAWLDAANIYGEAVVANETLYQISATDISRQRELSQTAGLFNNLAYALARLERYEDSVIKLEAGRTRILDEALSRDQVTLEQLEPEDRVSFEAARDRIKGLEWRARALDEEGASNFSEVSTELRAARQELAEIVDNIRTYKPDFMPAALNFEDIADSSSIDRPLVYLITTPVGSLALIVPHDEYRLGAEHIILLDNFNLNDLDELLVKTDADGDLVGGYLVGQVSANISLLQAELEKSLPILKKGLMGPLAERLVELGFRQATLVYSGKLMLLPLHVAAIEMVAFAYTPSARVLKAAATSSKERASLSSVFLGICNPLPNINPLAFARPEVENIESFFPVEGQRVLYEKQATRAETLKALHGATHLHFSCHGVFNDAEPLNSTIFLSGDDKVTLRDLLDGDLDLSTAQLAVLSACQTGITDWRIVPDEAIGFPAGFLRAGVPGVVSTLWHVDDISTAVLMSQFYRYHLEDGLEPAVALHKAQLWLRDATANEMDLAHYYETLFQASDRRDRIAFKFMRYYRTATDEKPFTHPYYWAPFFFSGV